MKLTTILLLSLSTLAFGQLAIAPACDQFGFKENEALMSFYRASGIDKKQAMLRFASSEADGLTYDNFVKFISTKGNIDRVKTFEKELYGGYRFLITLFIDTSGHFLDVTLAQTLPE
ncbi:MAG: hypothetical protein AAGH46_04445 [Bacteroidota bacterium]